MIFTAVDLSYLQRVALAVLLPVQRIAHHPLELQNACAGSEGIHTDTLLMQTGTEKLGALRVFLLSNNKIAAWSEVERLGGLTALEELLLVGNPLYNEFKDKGETQQYRIEVCFCCSSP